MTDPPTANLTFDKLTPHRL